MALFQNNPSTAKKQVNVDNTSLNILLAVFATLLIVLLATGIYFICAAGSNNGPIFGGNDSPTGSTGDYPYKQEISVTVPHITDDTEGISARTEGSTTGIYSEFAALIDMTDGKIIASKKGEREIYPASMCKVMTLIVAIENLPTEDAMDKELTITKEVVETMFAEGASGYGFKEGEVLTVRALLHALILQSDGVAAMTLAEYIAGSESAFVQMMNDKAQEIGMEDTAFQNCTGLDHEYLLTSCRDMGVMMMYAMQNPFCAEILSAKSYQLPNTFRQETGNTYTLYHATLASKFDKLKPNTTTVEVLAAKSGWTGKNSGYCLVTYAVGENGHKYVLVTAKAGSSEESIADMVYIYNTYAK